MKIIKGVFGAIGEFAACVAIGLAIVAGMAAIAQLLIVV